MTKNEPTRQPLLGRAQVIKLSRLIFMPYRPAEIAKLLDVHVDTVRRSYLASGCPFTRDSTGHIWIVGTEFREWALDVLAKRKRKRPVPMEDNQTYCFKCKKRVKIVNPTIEVSSHYLERVVSNCPICGTKCNRGRARQ